ncbi:MAG: cupin domain-containing protein [Myxococcota bacterium]
MSKLEKVNLDDAFASFSETWRPRIGGEINDFQIKLVKLEGSFEWHHHEGEDELFLVIHGRLLMKLRDGDIELGPGEYIIVPKGVEHCPVALPTCSVVLFEPKTTLNTGNLESDRTQRDLPSLA